MDIAGNNSHDHADNAVEASIDPRDDERKTPTKSTRSAEEYINAANAVIDIAEIAVSFIPGGSAAATVATKALKYAPIARKVIGKAPDVAPVAKQAADALRDKAPEAVNASAGKVFEAVKGATNAIGEKGSRVGNAIKSKVDARAEEKARREARRAILDGAGIRMPAEQFLENWRAQESLPGQAPDSYLAYCGCYVVSTYSSPVKNGDYGVFRELYVGKSSNIGASVFADLTGRGNADVYADVKYKQHVYVLLYPCAPEKIDQLEASLIVALDADESYNAVQ